MKNTLTFLEALDFAASMDPKLKFTLRLIKERRKRRANDMGIGRVALDLTQAPIVEALLKNYHPELYQDDAELSAKAMRQFINHPDSEPFRVNARV